MKGRSEKFRAITCRACGHKGSATFHLYGGGIKRAVCGRCGATLTTFLTSVDIFLLVLALGLVLLFLCL